MNCSSINDYRKDIQNSKIKQTKNNPKRSGSNKVKVSVERNGGQ